MLPDGQLDLRCGVWLPGRSSVEPFSLLGERDASLCKTYTEPFYMKPKSLFKNFFLFFWVSKTDVDVGLSYKWSDIKCTLEKQGILVIVSGAVLALLSYPFTLLSSPQDCDSRWYLRATCLISPRSWVTRLFHTRVVKANAWTQLCGRCLSSPLNCFLGAGMSQRQQGSLWAHLPFSLTPFLSSPSDDLLPEESQRSALL